MKKVLTAVLLFATTCATAQDKLRVDSLLNEKDSTVVQQRIMNLAAGNEDDKGIVLRYYIARRDEEKRDSLLAAIVKQYPNGWHAASTGLSKILETKGSVQKEALFTAYRQQFPGSNFNRIYVSIATAFAEERQTKKALEYLNKVNSATFRPKAICVIGEELIKYDLKTAAALVRQGLDSARSIYHSPVPIIVNGRKLDYRYDYFELVKLYGKVLMERKENALALNYIREAYDSLGWYDKDLASRYGLLLQRNGKYKEAFVILDPIVRAGNGNAETKAALAIAYQQLNPGKKGETYVAQAQEGLKNKIEEKVAKMLIDEKAPAFVLKDVSGKTVSLADFKGKTIVLDFWATWCGPCKESFPAMQKAVNKYSNDANVKFLFIHTWERTDAPQKDAQAYLRSNNYAFDLYMDTKDPISKKCPAVTLFDVKGIPAKFVIDGNGHIRFKVTGFSGGEDAAVDELTAMIEMAAGKRS